jgi:hypothetical protein
MGLYGPRSTKIKQQGEKPARGVGMPFPFIQMSLE